MSAMVGNGLPLPLVRVEASSSSNGYNHVVPLSSPNVPNFHLSKPSWIIQTESNVRKWVRKKPHPSCVICKGSGRVDCLSCLGRGRTNCTHLLVLPNGEWPKWCNVCGGSGLDYCDRCLGTGEYRDKMGFRFINTSNNQGSDCKPSGTQVSRRISAEEFLLGSVDPDN